MLKAPFYKELPEPETEPQDNPADVPELEPLDNLGENTPRTKEIGIQAVSDEVDLYREIYHHTNRANFYLKELEDLRTRVEIDHTRRKEELVMRPRSTLAIWMLFSDDGACICSVSLFSIDVNCVSHNVDLHAHVQCN